MVVFCKLAAIVGLSSILAPGIYLLARGPGKGDKASKSIRSSQIPDMPPITPTIVWPQHPRDGKAE